jgi:hypothetical protein
MSGKTLTQMETDVLVDLKSTVNVEFTAAEIDRGVVRAMGDLQRFLPRQKVYEKTLDFDEVTDEEVTLTAHGTYKDLANKPVKWDSERVCDDADETTTYTRDTDYTIDYTNGKITSIDGGSIGATDTIYVNYSVNRFIIDISGLTDLIRIDRVEYPVGQTPQQFCTWEVWGDLLVITGIGDESQSNLSSDKHIVIYYHAEHTAPTADAAGTQPPFLDYTVELAASAFCLFMKAVEYEFDAVTALTNMGTAAGNIAKYLDDNSGDDANTRLADITDKISDLSNVIGTALDAANAYLDEVDTTDLQGAEAVWAEEVKHILTAAGIPNAEDFLETGDDFIPTINVGANVPENYATFAQVALAMAAQWSQKRQDWINLASARTNAALAYIQEAAARLTNLRTHELLISGWIDIANGFAAQVDRYATQATGYLTLANQMRQEAIERRSEAWAIWRDPGQYMGDFSYTSVQQSARY